MKSKNYSSYQSPNDVEYSTAEVARMANIHRDTLLRWMREGDLPEVRKTENGYRVFTPEDVDIVLAFAHERKKKLT